jgi:hypothetical protein
MEQVGDWGNAIMASLAAALTLFMAAIPRIIGFLVILVIGWLIAGALAGATAALLRTVKFNELSQRAGISGFLRRAGVETDASGVMANIVKWFVRLIALVVAFDALGLPAVSQVLHDFLLWIPNLVVALVILVLAGLAANALGDVVRGATATAGLGNPRTFESIAKVAVWVFGIVIAVNQVGIATTLVNTLFMGFVGALALALGLAFGLGGRDTAGQIVAQWYRRGKEAAPRLQQAAEEAGRQAEYREENTGARVVRTQERMRREGDGGSTL